MPRARSSSNCSIMSLTSSEEPRTPAMRSSPCLAVMVPAAPLRMHLAQQLVAEQGSGLQQGQERKNVPAVIAHGQHLRPRPPGQDLRPQVISGWRREAHEQIERLRDMGNCRRKLRPKLRIVDMRDDDDSRCWGEFTQRLELRALLQPETGKVATTFGSSRWSVSGARCPVRDGAIGCGPRPGAGQQAGRGRLDLGNELCGRSLPLGSEQ